MKTEDREKALDAVIVEIRKHADRIGKLGENIRLSLCACGDDFDPRYVEDHEIDDLLEHTRCLMLAYKLIKSNAAVESIAAIISHPSMLGAASFGADLGFHLDDDGPKGELPE